MQGFGPSCTRTQRLRFFSSLVAEPHYAAPGFLGLLAQVNEAESPKWVGFEA